VRVDGFAPIAEAQGHMVADRVLFKVAHRMRRRLRTTDYLGRWEGEVFLIVCPETDLPEALSMSTRMRRAIKSQAMGHVGIVTACFGLCTLSGHADGEAMLAEAEGWLTQGLPRSRDRVFSRQDQTAASAGESVQERSSSES
jgi:polar amino acid transport system substrate-binding protein